MISIYLIYSQSNSLVIAKLRVLESSIKKAIKSKVMNYLINQICMNNSFKNFN